MDDTDEAKWARICEIIQSDPRDEHTGRSLFRRGFWLWLRDQKRLWRFFEQYTFEMIRRGRKHYSSKVIVNVARYHTDLANDIDDEGFKINDRWQASLGHLFMHLYPQHTKFFRTRSRRRGTVATY